MLIDVFLALGGRTLGSVGRGPVTEGAKGIRSPYGNSALAKGFLPWGKQCKGQILLGNHSLVHKGVKSVSPLCPSVLPLRLVQGTQEPFPC